MRLYVLASKGTREIHFWDAHRCSFVVRMLNVRAEHIVVMDFVLQRAPALVNVLENSNVLAASVSPRVVTMEPVPPITIVTMDCAYQKSDAQLTANVRTMNNADPMI